MAEDTELAKAYIPIVPSMDGFTSKLSQMINNEAATAGESAGRTLGSGMLGTLGKVLSAAAIGKLLKDSFLEGAALEQSIGGVETLFKESADDIKANAAEAYRTAGLSANEYMETATSFSASLLKSLEGDTKAAAEHTQTAITDMSDNVNKFGGDIQNLQNAYQGFARDNFTMLDNLRLGYAGNKAGMESLLRDAEALSGIHYDISSYADMIDAIHVIQESLDITGTTAEEASNTFSGSFNAMQASAKNLAGTLTAGGDVDKALEGLKESSADFGSNVLRMLGNLHDGLGVTGDILLEGTAIAAGYAGALTLTAAVEGITGFVKEAKEANGVMAALDLNPLAVGAAAALAIGTGIKIAVDNMTYAINEIPDAYAGLDESQRELVDSTAELVSGIYDSANARSDGLAAIEAERESTGILIDEIYKLNAAEKLDAGTKAQLSALVGELNERYPELNLELDEQTGHLNKLRGAVEALTEAENLNAKTEEARSQFAEITEQHSRALEKQTEAEKMLREAQSERDKVQEQLNAAQKEYDYIRGKPVNIRTGEELERMTDLSELLPQLKEKLEDTQNAVGETANAYSLASVAVHDLDSELESSTTILTIAEQQEQAAQDRINTVQAVVDRMKDYVIATSENTYYISQDTYDKIQEISAGYYESVQAQEDAIRRSLDLFSEFSGGAQTSADEMFAALESNKEGIELWAENLRTLAGWGIDEGLLKTLEDAGPASANKVKALVDMGEPRLKEYSDLWEQTQATIHSTAEQQMEATKEASLDAIAELIRQPGEAKPDMEEAWAVLGAASPESYLKSFGDRAAQIAPVTGQMLVQEIIRGVRRNQSTLDAAMRQVVDNSMQYALELELERQYLPLIESMRGNAASAVSNAAVEAANAVAASSVSVGFSRSSAVNADIPSSVRNEGAAPDVRPTVVQVVTPDRREIASLLIDDINDLQAAELNLAGRGYI